MPIPKNTTCSSVNSPGRTIFMFTLMTTLSFYYRTLSRNKVFSLISIGGFSLSLAGFAFKTRLDWWIFGLAALVALVVAILTVSWQSWRAARRTPVEALRYE